MYFARDSFTIVILGDWNEWYMQPGWIAENVFEDQEMEIGVNGQGVDYAVSYKKGNIVIGPTQNQMIFSAFDATSEDLNQLVNCVNRFTKSAYTPFVFAYGFNCDYFGDDGTLFADVIDNMHDNSCLIDCGYEIASSKVTRTLAKEGRIIIFDSSLDGTEVKIHFNQHYGETIEGNQMPEITVDEVNQFLDSCHEIIHSLGYDIEEDE